MVDHADEACHVFETLGLWTWEGGSEFAELYLMIMRVQV